MTALLTVQDVAERTGLKEATVRKFARDRIVDVIRSDPTTGAGRILFTEAQYDQLLDALTVRAKQATPAKARKPRRGRRSS